ncbi:hypothetical protein V5799_010173 [Amblyomma americanum]|uniref:Uncharacterized protein n=1 Tax=Amblyomma americanum TaxID=6943 RepID=A0AAQ4F8D4_AMBAM
MFDTAKKGPQESWRQFGYQLRSYYSYYTSSRKVTETEELMELVVVDKLKEALPNDALRQIALQENKSWLKIDEPTEVVEAVESSRGKPSGASVPRMGMASGEGRGREIGGASPLHRQEQIEVKNAPLKAQTTMRQCYRCA